MELLFRMDFCVLSVPSGKHGPSFPDCILLLWCKYTQRFLLGWMDASLQVQNPLQLMSKLGFISFSTWR